MRVASAFAMRHSGPVPARASKFVVAGFAAVLALAIGLVQLTHSATPVEPARPARGPDAASPPAQVASAPESHTPPSAARERLAAPIAPRAPSGRPAHAPEIAPPQIGFSRELKRDANGKLVPIIALQELQPLLHLANAPMQACVERLGQRATGAAMLNFTVAAKNDKLVIETTGIQDEDTLAAYPDLLECMHRTASALVLDGHAVPELGTPIYVRRPVRLENGALAADTLLNFSYNP